MTAQKKILKKTTFQWPVSLKRDPSLLVKKNQLISRGDPIAKTIRRTCKTIDLAVIFKAKGKKILPFLVKKLGREVKKGDLLAKKKLFLSTKKVFSPMSGKLASLSEKGILKICRQQEETIKSDFSGRIISATDKKIVVEFPALKLEGQWGLGHQAIGNLKTIPQGFEKEALFKLGPENLGKILLVRGKISKAFWFKTLSLGIKGLVCGFLPQGGLKKLMAQHQSLINEGGGDLSPLVMIGQEEIDKQAWAELKKHEGKKSLIIGEEANLVIPIQK